MNELEKQHYFGYEEGGNVNDPAKKVESDPTMEKVLQNVSAVIPGERMRFVYFSVLFATAYWFLISLVRWIIAKRNVNVIVETPERNAKVNALERAWSVEDTQTEDDQ